MLTSTIKRNAFRVVATLAFAAAPAFASLIPITNFSFETLPAGGLPSTAGCPGGCVYAVAAIPGWTNTGVSGQMQPSATQFTSLDLGPTSAFSNDGIISQTVGTTVGTGTVYTLRVDIGQRLDSGSFGGSADLLIGATALNGGAHFITASGSAPLAGRWSTFSASYTGLAADAGATMTIELRSVGLDANGANHQGNFDNVRLDVPEPASFLLIGSALLALTAIRRRRPIARPIA
jgi:PEP-CTERM motif